jgi:hypothetical protein
MPMSMNDYEQAKSLVEEHEDLADFDGPQPDSLLEKAEETLGVRFPPTYRRFLSEFGAGGFGASEFYGVFREDFESSGVPDAVWRALKLRREGGFPEHLVPVASLGDGDLAALDLSGGGDEAPVIAFSPGVPPDEQELERLASDFGAFFREHVEAELE